MAVDNGDLAVSVADQLGRLQRSQRDRDPRPPNSEHHREKFVAEGQFGARRAITGGQQPPGKARR